jgi:Xaa-Pro aminopeptidase
MTQAILNGEKVAEHVARRRDRIVKAWGPIKDVVLVGAGVAIPIPGGADQTFPFVSHAEYFWLTDRETPGGVLAYDPNEGWTDFVPDVTTAERVWEGRTDTPGTSLVGLAGWLAARRFRPIAMLGTPLPGVVADASRTLELRDVLTHTRRAKDQVELERMRAAARASAAGYEAARRAIKVGATERGIQIEMEAEFFRHGGQHTAYDSIVASGPNSAVLHFLPTGRVLQPGDAVLIDAGAEVGRYVSDITRTYRVPGGDAGFFRELYAIVLEVLVQAIPLCTAGREWRDIHFDAARRITAGLVELGLLYGAIDTLVERDAHALFFPHGLGHMVGLGVRDASGYVPGRARSTRPGLTNLRTDLPLEVGYAMTVEPGIYFIPALLRDAELRKKHRDVVAWDKVDRLMDFGGVRIEDNVVVTTGAPEVLTSAVPKGVDDALATG